MRQLGRVEIVSTAVTNAQAEIVLKKREPLCNFVFRFLMIIADVCSEGRCRLLL